MAETKSLRKPENLSTAEILKPYVECCICMNVLYNAASCTPCLHTFCMGCIARWSETNQRSCPMCRKSVREITPNWVARDMVKKYLLVKPEAKRSEGERDELDQAELEFLLKWLGENDDQTLHVEAISALQGLPVHCDQQYFDMLNRATELFRRALRKKSDKPFLVENLKAAMATLVKDIRKELFPAALFTKYHRLERAYRKMVRYSMPKIGPAEHTWLGTYFFDKDFVDPMIDSDESFDGEEEDDWDLEITDRISEAIEKVIDPNKPSRRPSRPSVGGFDPVDLQALARVQSMRAPGFRREIIPLSPRSPSPPQRQVIPSRARTTRYITSSHSSSPSSPAEPPQQRHPMLRRQYRELEAAENAAREAATAENVSVVPIAESITIRRRSARLAARSNQ